jgi:hypothetical protein
MQMFARYRIFMNYLWHGIIHRHVTLHVTAVHVVDRHSRVKLWSWWNELSLHRIWIVVLDNTVKWLGTHGSKLLVWSPRWTLRLREERRVLGPNIETFGIISALLGWLGSLVLACPIFG